MYPQLVNYVVVVSRRPGGGIRRGEGSRSLLEQLVLMIGGGRGAVTAGAPFVLVGAPGDYVFGGEGEYAYTLGGE